MKTYLKLCAVFLCTCCMLNISCKKFLDEKPDQRLTTPSTLSDLQGLMDNYNFLYTVGYGAGEASADDYYLETASFNSIAAETDRRQYTWEPSYLFPPNTSTSEWYIDYRAIFYANTVLQNIKNLEKTNVNSQQWNDIAGQAYFYRGQFFLRAALVWALAFDEQTATSDLGIPLRLTDDFNIPSVRSNNLDTYTQILSDLKHAAEVLPVRSIHLARPTKQAAFGLLARTNLAMRRYKEAGLYADSCLQLYSNLLDYNTLNAADAYPIKQFNSEVIWWSRIFFPSTVTNTVARIDNDLYNSYASTDLRRQIFFITNANGTHGFKGFYEGAAAPFGGVATDEVLLTRAECYAREGETLKAMNDLNRLLKNRYINTTAKPYVNLTANTGAQALEIILKERRKQLLMRNLRWLDLKRLNKDGANITLQRVIDGKTYTLPPNDLRYALPIPEDVIALSGIPQNKR